MTQAERLIQVIDDNDITIVKDEKPMSIVKPPKKVSRLKAVDPKAAEPSKPKILVSGKPGVGKTWAALDFPKVFYVDTEGGANLSHYTDKLSKSGGAYFGPEQGALSFEDIIEQIKALATEDHQYKTLVIDSISKIFYEEISREQERLGSSDQYGASKKPAVGFMRRLVSWIMRLDMNVILIAHSKAEWGLDAKGSRSEIGTTFDAWDKLEYELHLWLEISKAGPNRRAKVRKSRLENFPDGDVFSWSYAEFAQLYGVDVIEKKGEAIRLSTSEQLSKIRELLELWKAPDGQQEKWFKSANVTSYEDMNTDVIASLIKHIETKIKGDK